MLLTVRCPQPGCQGPSHSLPGWNRLLPRRPSLPCHSPGAHGQDRWWAATRGGKPPFQVSSLWKELFLKSTAQSFPWKTRPQLSLTSPMLQWSLVSISFQKRDWGCAQICVLIFTQTHMHTHTRVHTRTQNPPSPFSSGLLQSDRLLLRKPVMLHHFHQHSFCPVEGGLASKQANKRRVGAGVRPRQRRAGGWQVVTVNKQTEQKGHVSGTGQFQPPRALCLLNHILSAQKLPPITPQLQTLSPALTHVHTHT